MPIALAGLTVLALGLAACGGDDDEEAADTTVATTVAATTTTTVVVSPTTAAPATTTVDPADTSGTTAPPATAPPSTAPASGLEDLVLYWGYVSELSEGDTSTITIDVADVFFGEAAVAEGAADGIDVPTDIDPVIYVRNTTVEPQVLELIPELAVTVNGCDYGQGPLPGCDTATAGSLRDIPVETGQLVLFQLSSGRVARLDIPFFP